MSQTRKKLLITLGATIMMIFVGVVAAWISKSDEKELSAKIVLFEGEEIKSWYNSKDSVYYYFLPSHVEISKAHLAIPNDVIYIDGKAYRDGDSLDGLSFDKEYVVEGSSNHKNAKLVIRKSENVSTMYVETATESMKEVYHSKNHKEIAHIMVVDANGDVDEYLEDSAIKGHGNSTWYADKKSFTLFLNDQVSILGMGESDKWVLLANASDVGQLRNKLVLDVADQLSVPSALDCEYVNLYLNGEYNGLYLVAESPDTIYERSEKGADGLFLFTSEMVERAKSANLAIPIQEGKAMVDVVLPKKLGNNEKETAENIINNLDQAILNKDNELGNVIDIDSWAKKYLIDEIFANYDAGIASSYFYTYSNGDDNLVYAGPIWDYDSSMANRSGYSGPTLNPEILYAKNEELRSFGDRNVMWYSYLYDNPVFYNRMVEIFEKQFVPAIEQMLEYEVDDLEENISAACENNEIRWDLKNDQESEYIKDYLSKRMAFLKSIWIDNEEYCVVRASKPTTNKYYSWFYVKKGSVLSDNEYYDQFLGGADWYIEGTGEKIDFDSPILENTYVSNMAPKSNRMNNAVLLYARKKKSFHKMFTSTLLVICMFISCMFIKRKGI